MTDYLTEELINYGLPKDSFLRILKECNAVVAGSFPLSVMLKERGIDSFESGDIDIFIDGYSPVRKLILYLEGYLEDDYQIQDRYYSNESESQSYTDISEIKSLSWGKDMSKHIQILVVKGCPKKYINTFDLTCCQTFIDNDLGKILTFDHHTFMKEARFTCTIKDLRSDWHWGAMDKRFKKYLDRGFTFYLDDMDITQALRTSKHIKEVYKELLSPTDFKKSVKDTFLLEHAKGVAEYEVYDKLSWGYIKNVVIKEKGAQLDYCSLYKIVCNPDVNYDDLTIYFTSDRCPYLFDTNRKITDRDHPIIKLIAENPSWRWVWDSVNRVFTTFPWDVYAKAKLFNVSLNIETLTELDWYREELYDTIRKYPAGAWNKNTLIGLPDVPLDVLDIIKPQARHARYISRMSTVTENYISGHLEWLWDWNTLIEKDTISKDFIMIFAFKRENLDADLLFDKFGVEFAKDYLQRIDIWDMYVKYVHIMLFGLT